MIQTHTVDAEPSPTHGPPRRDFLYVATMAATGVGAVATAWPLVDSMNPSADVLAVASIEADLGPIAVGQRITVEWRSRPVFIVHRTAAEIAAARADDAADLRDPQPDAERAPRAEWLIVVGICTHLGCIPLGQRGNDPLGGWGGWFCPCHGSHYDTSGRVRKGPAPRNLDVPPYAFLSDTIIRIG
ncbi:MAG: ubiquinol-cytochrome c reductase iron-sulfur subunit [Alphaproteobacteria bacterium]